jgi:1,4-alpha-glucan branching enzyme
MIELVRSVHNFQAEEIVKLWEKDDDQVLAYMRGDLVFVFNFNPSQAFEDYGILAPEGTYMGVLSTDSPEFGGYDNINLATEHVTQFDELYAPAQRQWLKLYLPPRTAMVLRRNS